MNMAYWACSLTGLIYTLSVAELKIYKREFDYRSRSMGQAILRSILSRVPDRQTGTS